MRDVAPEIQRRGAELVVIGPGSPKEASQFAERSKLDATYLVSPDLAAYRAAGFKRSLTGAVNLTTLKAGLEARRAGFKQGKIAGDVFQLGGAVVISREGEVLFEHSARHSADHVAPEDLVAALPT